MHPTPPSGVETRNLLISIVLATLVMIGWQYFYEAPRQAAQQAVVKAEAARKATEVAKPETKTAETNVRATGPRIAIRTPALHGSLALTGARFDQLTLAHYHESTAVDSPEVTLLNQAESAEAYFIELGMLSDGAHIAVPDAATVWQADGAELTPQTPVTLRWNNGAGLLFEKKISVDANAMFTVTTTVTNRGAAAVTLYPYGLISRNHDVAAKGTTAFLHEGPLGVFNQVLEDASYQALKEDGAKKFEGAEGWVGMADKYWLTAILPEAGKKIDAGFKYFTRGAHEAYQADIRGEALEVPVGQSTTHTLRVFAGAKVVATLDAYAAQYQIPLFDRAVDFGTLYFIAKPIFGMLTFFHGLVGNFGVAILLLTVCIKAALFPLASKSMVSMARMKQLMPKMTEIRERYSNDKLKMNQEIMALYKREKVNPVGGCLPMLLQLPVFFALYRVLFVTIEMRHAPFFGWVKDLSATDPSNIFTGFGLIPWVIPSFLHLGVWPMIMCATMVIQQRINPKPADEVQAMVMQYMPYMFLFLFAGFPAGLVIYWVCNNTLTILQQLYINRQLDKKGLR